MACYNHGIVRWFPHFAGFTQFNSTIPKLYWDVESQEQRILELCKTLHKLICYIDFVGDKVNVNHEEIEKLKADFQEFIESGFDDYYREQIEQWINDHLPDIMHMLIRQVFFGLTLDGHFVAYIPESWDDIVFDTGMNYQLDTYGRLILRWDADSPYSVDQTPEIVRPYTDESLRQQIINIMNTLYAVPTGGGSNV